MSLRFWDTEQELRNRKRVVGWHASNLAPPKTVADIEASLFTQLSTPLPVHVIDKGPGLAFAVIDYGPEHNLLWITALDDGGEIWLAPNPKVRMQANWSMGRTKSAETEVQPGIAKIRGWA